MKCRIFQRSTKDCLFLRDFQRWDYPYEGFNFSMIHDFKCWKIILSVHFFGISHTTSSLIVSSMINNSKRKIGSRIFQHIRPHYSMRQYNYTMVMTETCESCWSVVYILVDNVIYIFVIGIVLDILLTYMVPHIAATTIMHARWNLNTFIIKKRNYIYPPKLFWLPWS